MATPWGKRQAIRVLGHRKYDLSKVHTHTLPIDQLDRAMRILGGEVAGEEAVHITVTPGGRRRSLDLDMGLIHSLLEVGQRRRPKYKGGIDSAQ